MCSNVAPMESVCVVKKENSLLMLLNLNQVKSLLKAYYHVGTNKGAVRKYRNPVHIVRINEQIGNTAIQCT